MNGYWLTLGIVGFVLAFLLGVVIVIAVCNVKIAKHRPCGCDPRSDPSAVDEASRQVRDR